MNVAAGILARKQADLRRREAEIVNCSTQKIQESKIQHGQKPLRQQQTISKLSGINQEQRSRKSNDTGDEISNPVSKVKHKGYANCARASSLPLDNGDAKFGSKKLSFKDLMSQANSVNKDKLKMEIKVKPFERKKKIALKPSESVEKVGEPVKELIRKNEKAPLVAQSVDYYKQSPSEASIDSFVEDDELHNVSSEHRQEIRRIFRRNGNSSHRDEGFESDSDDMEATGVEILHEESRSAAVARMEDLEEEARETAREVAKRDRKRKRTR